jgi:hypothetical protein
LSVLVSIVQSYSEESLVCRACRCLANAAKDDHKNAIVLHSFDILTVLVRTLAGMKSPKAKQVVVRAIR